VVHAVFEYCSFYLPLAKAGRVVTFHHVVGKGENNSRKWFLLWRIAARMSIVFSDRIIAVSSQTKKEILRKYPVDPGKIEVITHVPMGFHVDGGVRKEHVLGCMGTINERKNFSAAVRVFASISSDPRFSDYRLVICGKGRLKSALVEQARSLGLEGRVDFIQDISKEEMVEFYNRCSLVLNTSTHEGLGLATVEAQMCGTPVLYFKDAEIPPEVMVAAVPCEDEADMACKAMGMLDDRDRMDAAVADGLRFTKRLGEDFRDRTWAVYQSVLGKRK